MTVFVDSSFWIALEDSKDQDHDAAAQYWAFLASRRPRVLSTTFILGEVAAFFTRRGKHTKAVTIGEYLLFSEECDCVSVDPPLLDAAWDYFVARSDKTYSLTDCISFVLMEREGIREALTFDHHFEQAGFVRLPA